MQEKSFYMVGMPESGKTTFLISLCTLLLHAEKKTLLKLKAEDLPYGYENIEILMKRFGAGKVVGRTIDSTQYDIIIPLEDGEKNDISLFIPDLSGEFYRDLVNDRRIKKDIVDRLICADEILFFINTNTMIKERRLALDEKSTMKRIIDEVEEKNSEKNGQESSKNDSLLAPEKQKTNQSHVVDLLQSIVYLLEKKIKIKIIFSAWDKVEERCGDKVPSPEEYLKDELPLLYQYIKSNSKKMEYQIWGISAQGREFYSEENGKLEECDDASSDIKVVDCNKNETYDLTKLLYV